jgi:CRP-like cAMP-binding protein
MAPAQQLTLVNNLFELTSTALRHFVSHIHPLKPEEMIAFEAIWQPFVCKRKTLLTKPGDPERYLYFVLEGVQRGYAVTQEGQEHTIVFTYPHSFAGVADAFITETPSAYFFETLTASSLLRTTHHQLNVLMQAYPAIYQLIFISISWAFKGALERQVELQSFSSEERFRKLLTRSPQVLNLIPHKYLASYLGMDAATFSKLLRTVRVG